MYVLVDLLDLDLELLLLFNLLFVLACAHLPVLALYSLLLYLHRR